MGNPPTGSMFSNPSSYTGLVFWVDATTITGLSSGASISNWSDASGNGNNATASVVSSPTYVSSSTYLNNNAGVSFATTQLSYLSAAFTLVQPETVFFVCSTRTGAASQFRFLDGLAANSMLLYTITNAPNATGSFTEYAGNVLNSASTFSANVAFLGTAVFNGANSLVQLNGETAVTGNCGVGNGAGITIGSSGGNSLNLNNNADFGEIVIYNRALSTSEILKVQNYLSTKWGTP